MKFGMAQSVVRGWVRGRCGSGYRIILGAPDAADSYGGAAAAAVRTSVPAFEVELSLLRGFGAQPTPHSGPTAPPNDPSQGQYVGRASTWTFFRNRRQTLRTAERGSSGGLFVSIERPPVQQYATPDC
jgi:hypothetical protein